MRAIAINKFGGPEVLELIDAPVPEPGPGEVLIRVCTTAVNPTDTLLRSGKLARAVESLKPPYIPGMDASGTVIATGSNVELMSSTRVMAFVNPFTEAGGAQAEYIAVPESQVAAIPQSLDLEAAGGLPMNGLTANLAIGLMDFPPGSTVAITGGPGALGGYAIQLAKQAGLHVVADAFAKDRMLLEELGADIVVPRGPEIAKNFREAIPDGADGLIDAAITGEQGLGIIKDNGVLVKCRPYELPTERGIIIRQVNVLAPDPARKLVLERLASLADEEKISLRTAAIFAPEEAAETHRRIEAGGVRGRLLIRF
jgi:NADPH:quinone reductase-like Zn-dependent oxidoreductase